MMYCTFATLFILQAHGVTLEPSRLIAMLFLLLVYREIEHGPEAA